MNRSTVMLLAAAAISARALPAQSASPAARNVVPTVGFSLGSASISRDRATIAEVGQRSWGLQLEGGVIIKRFFIIGVDLGGQFLSDRAQFTQNTTGGEMKSTANITYLSAMTGVRTGALGPLSLAANVGIAGAMARRSIDNCTDCHVDKLEIPAGTFVEPALHIRVRRFEVRVIDRLFFGGDGLRSVTSVGAQFALPQKKR